MSEIKVSKISSLSAAQTLQVGGKGMMIGGTAENTTLIISTTAGGIPTIPHGDMSLFITDGTIQSTYGYQTTTGSVVGEFLGTYSNHPVGIMTSNATRLFISATGNVGIGTTTPDAVLDVPGVKANSNGVMHHYTDLAQLHTTNNVAGMLNGALQIVLPYNFSVGRNTMMTVKIMGNSYRSKSVSSVGGHSWEVILTAYFSTSNGSQWYTSSLVPTVEIKGHAPFSTVRLGARLTTAATDAGKAVILLGDDSTIWNYLNDFGYTVAVTDLWTSYDNREGWGQGWKINHTPILDSAFASQFETVASGKMFTCRVDQYTDMNGNVGIGTTTPGLKFDVAGGIRASLKLITEEAFALAPAQLHTTQRTFTQVFTANGSGSASLTVVGDAWLIGTFSDDNAIPGHFRFVHNNGLGENLQSGSYEWTRSYAAEGLAVGSPPTTGSYTEWVELPVSISMAYGVSRNFRFDVRKQNTGLMQLRMRAMTAGIAGGAHYFTFTTTGSTTYTPAAGGAPTTTATAAPSGFHGRQSYEFPVSRNLVTNGYCGFKGSTAGLFILNGGNVGVGSVNPQDTLTVTPPFSEAPQGIGFYSAENLLRNGNWPNTTVAGQAAEGWTVATYNGASDTTNGSASWVTVATGPRGVTAIALQCNSGGGAYQTVSLTPGAVYTVSARIRVASTGNTADNSAARFAIGVAGTPTSISDAYIDVNLHDSGNSVNKWCYCSQTFTVPASASLLTTIYVGVRSAGNTHLIHATDMALYKGGIAKVFSPISVQEDTQRVLINGIPAAYTEPSVSATGASATTGFRFGAIGATALTNYSGYTVRYTKIGNLVQVEGLICNLPTAALGVPANSALLKGLPPIRPGNNSISAVGWLQWVTATPMTVSTTGDLFTQTAFSIPGGNGTTTGGFIGLNFSYLTT